MSGGLKLVSDYSDSLWLIEAARNFYDELREISRSKTDRLIDEMAAVYRMRGKCRAGHPMTLENTQSIGKAGYRCRQCRRQISRESARRCAALAKAQPTDRGAE